MHVRVSVYMLVKMHHHVFLSSRSASWWLCLGMICNIECRLVDLDPVSSLYIGFLFYKMYI